MVLDSKQLRLEKVSLDTLGEAARSIIDFGNKYKVWLFRGDMGAGKTTLIRALAEQFSIEDTISSPTYSLVNEYRNTSADIFFHFDFYRIENELEALEIGVEDYFYSGNYCFVEWPSKISRWIPQQHFELDITFLDNHTRNIDLIQHD